MNKYILRKTIDDEIEAPTHYEAFLELRKRQAEGYYNIRQEDIEFDREVEESSTSTPEDEQT